MAPADQLAAKSLMERLLQEREPQLVEPSAELLELVNSEHKRALFAGCDDLFQHVASSADFDADSIAVLRFHLRVTFNDVTVAGETAAVE